MPFVIRSWDDLYEDHKSRIVKKLAYVQFPPRMTDELADLVASDPNGAAHFGLFCALLQISACAFPRGAILKDNGDAHDMTSLRIRTLMAPELIEAGLERMKSARLRLIEEVADDVIKEMARLQTERLEKSALEKNASKSPRKRRKTATQTPDERHDIAADTPPDRHANATTSPPIRAEQNRTEPNRKEPNKQNPTEPEGTESTLTCDAPVEIPVGSVGRGFDSGEVRSETSATPPQTRPESARTGWGGTVPGTPVASPEDAPAINAGVSHILRRVTDADIENTRTLVGLFHAVCKSGKSDLKATENDRLKFVAAACRAKRMGTKKAAFFVDFVKNGRWAILANEDDEAARQRLKAYEAQQAARERQQGQPVVGAAG